MSSEVRSDLGKLDLVGLTDLSAEWGVSRQRVQVLAMELDFPEPAIKMYGPNGRVAHRLWVGSEVRAWKREREKFR